MRALASLAFLALASGADRYVSSSRGSDANSGASPDAPWASLAHAAGASAGLRDARVLLRSGDAFELPAPGAAGVAFGLLSNVSLTSYADDGSAARPRLVRTASPATGATLVFADSTRVTVRGLEFVGGVYGVLFQYDSATGPGGAGFGDLSVVDCSFVGIRGVDYDPQKPSWWGAGVAFMSTVPAGPVALGDVALAHNIFSECDTMFSPYVEFPNTNPCTLASLSVDANTCVGCSFNALFLDLMQVATVTRSVFLRDAPRELFAGGTTDIIIGYLDARSSVVGNEVTARGEFAGAPDGCAVDFETNSTGLLFANNYISRAWGAGVMVFGEDVYGSNQGLRVLNNTLVKNSCGGSTSPDRGQMAFTSPGSGGVIEGNVFVTCAGVPVFQDGSEKGLPLWEIGGNAIAGKNATVSVAQAPLVSAARRPDGSVLVTASSPTPGTQLVFTTDGSRPERGSPPFPAGGLALAPGFRATAVLVKAFFSAAPAPGVVAVESESAGGILSTTSDAPCC
jgi:hypothetical protein